MFGRTDIRLVSFPDVQGIAQVGVLLDRAGKRSNLFLASGEPERSPDIERDFLLIGGPLANPRQPAP